MQTAEALAYETQTSPRTQRLEPRARRTLSAAKLRELSTPKQTDEPRAVDRMQSDPQDGLQPPSGGVNHDVLFRQQAADGLATAAAAELSEGMAEQAIDKCVSGSQCHPARPDHHPQRLTRLNETLRSQVCTSNSAT